LGQIRKTDQQIQNELDEIHSLWSNGATDEYIMRTRDIKRAQFYRYKQKLVEQISEIWANKQEIDYSTEVQLCKERLTRNLNRAEITAERTDNPLWGQLAAELAVSILKLEYEGIASLQNGRFKQLEEKAGYLELKPATTDVPTSEANGMATTAGTTTSTTTNDERQF
jgi:hypothetical protein